MDAKKTRQPPLAGLEIDFSITKKNVGILWTKNVDTSTWAKILIRKELMMDILHLVEAKRPTEYLKLTPAFGVGEFSIGSLINGVELCYHAPFFRPE